MSIRGAFRWLAGLGSICFIILLIDTRYNHPLEQQIPPELATVNVSAMEIKPISQSPRIEKPILAPRNITHVKEVDTGLTEKVERIADLQRKIIRHDMEDYQYPNEKHDGSIRKLEDLLIEENGKPIRNIILTTWRSGSTFFGDVINAHPATFFHQEPLSDFDIVQIRGPPLATDALKRVKTLFNCEFADQGEYLEYSATHPWAFYYNTHVWKQCGAHKDLCYNHEYLSTMCKLFPFQLMKLVRLSLGVAQELLADEKLAVRMVLLVRDPRGTIQSRKHREWCPPSPDCSDPALLCADLASNYKIAVKLLEKYPTTFKVIRYEDLAAEPYERVKEISEFYGLDFHKNMKVFLDTHTKNNRGGVSSTFRDSQKAPYHWRSELTFEEVTEIQQSCIVAMKHWGYEPALNATHQRDFNPLTNYILSL